MSSLYKSLSVWKDACLENWCSTNYYMEKGKDLLSLSGCKVGTMRNGVRSVFATLLTELQFPDVVKVH